MEIQHITDLASALQTVRSSPSSLRVTIDETDWLGEVDPDEIDQLYSRFEALYQQHLESCIRELGPSSYTDADDRERVDGWYAEALRLASWQQGDGCIFLGLAHPDRETPIFIELGSISQAEIDALSE